MWKRSPLNNPCYTYRPKIWVWQFHWSSQCHTYFGSVAYFMFLVFILEMNVIEKMLLKVALICLDFKNFSKTWGILICVTLFCSVSLDSLASCLTVSLGGRKQARIISLNLQMTKTSGRVHKCCTFPVVLDYLLQWFFFLPFFWFIK